MTFTCVHCLGDTDNDDDYCTPCANQFRADQLTRELKDIMALLRDVRETLDHAHIFIYTREKMHPDGRLLYEACMRKVRDAVAPAQP